MAQQGRTTADPAVARAPAHDPLVDAPLQADWRTIGCGSVGTLLAQMVLQDEGRIANLLALKPAYPTGFNVRATTAGANAVDALRAGVVAPTEVRAVSPWLRVYPQAGAPQPRTRLEIGAPIVQYYSRRSRSYQSIGPSEDLSTQLCTQSPGGERCARVAAGVAASSADAVTIDPGRQLAGRWAGSAIDANDIVTMVVSVPVRTTGPGRFLARVGADFLEQTGTSSRSATSLLAGASSLQRIDADWSSVSFTAFRGGGVQSPGGGPPPNFLLANPPPCATR